MVAFHRPNDVERYCHAGTLESEGRCTLATCGYLSGHTDLSSVTRQIGSIHCDFIAAALERQLPAASACARPSYSRGLRQRWHVSWPSLPRVVPNTANQPAASPNQGSDAAWGWRIGQEDDKISARGDLHEGIFTVPADLAFSLSSQ
ncbi:MAG TPA: hypothetical protein VGF24_36955 [Vicinamibacterales bacterium]